MQYYANKKYIMKAKFVQQTLYCNESKYHLNLQTSKICTVLDISSECV